MNAVRPDLELRIDRVVAGGEGMGRDDEGRVVFVGGALPGERVAVRVTETKSGYARGQLLEIVDAASERVTPPCPYVAEGCGGCTWQHIDPVAQRRLKADIVEDALRRIGRIAEPPPIDLGPDLATTAYRTTVRCAVVDGRAGFRHYRSHDVVPVDHCLVTHRLIDELITVGRYHGCDEVTLRCGAATGERLVVASPNARGVQVPDDVVVTSPKVSGAWIHEVVAGRRWRIGAGSFFQARPDGAAALVDTVIAAAKAEPDPLPERPVVTDLYSGVGLFAGTVGDALGAGRVMAVESSASAVRDARFNLAADGAVVVRSDIAKWRPIAADLVVADPARTGLGKAAAARIVATEARRIVLISCDPASLGRDTALLNASGYTLTSATLVDLFPHTPHVEVVARFDL